MSSTMRVKDGVEAEAQVFDILVVGAGPAGLTMANLLGQGGLRVLLVEREPGLSELPKALLVDDEFFRLLATLGLRDEISAHGVFPISFDYFSPMGWRVGHVEASVTEHHYSRRTATFQPEFEAILLTGARRFAGFEARFGHSLLGFAEDERGVTTQLAGPKGEVCIRARYLVGADGSHSTVRKLFAIPFDEVRKFGDRHIVVDVEDDPDASPVAVTRLGWVRNYVSLPAPRFGRRYEVSLLACETDDAALLEDGALARMLAPICNDIRTRRVIRKAIYTFHARIARRLSKGRVHLVGDAAHVMPIFGSQGMNSGARDVKNLGWKLVEVIHGRADPALLETYHDERFEHLVETIKIAVANGKLQSARRLPITMARDLLLGASSLIPAFSRWIRDMRYIPKPYLRSGIVVQDGLPDPKSLVGRVLPNPLIRPDRGEPALLDDVVGPGFVLLGMGIADVPAGGLSHGWLLSSRATLLQLRAPDAPPPAPLERVSTAVLADRRLAEALAFHAGQWLVVRPDRIVAAALAPDDLADGLDRLAAILAHGPDARPVRRAAQPTFPLLATEIPTSCALS